MERYDYLRAVEEDVRTFIEETYDLADFDSIEAFEAKIYDDAWVEDSVTGNASGSYWFSSWEAEEALCHNWNLVEEACNEFAGTLDDMFKFGAESTDVWVRTYVLGEAVANVLADSEFSEKWEEAHTEEDDDEYIEH